MKSLIVVLVLWTLVSAYSQAQTRAEEGGRTAAYLGFDRNDYPGDANLKVLRQTFSYAGYWLNNPPGEKANSWAGHRAAVANAGFGFLVLFNGRLYAELKSVGNARRLGEADAAKAATAARREGFHAQTIIFLDQEQGGRMLPEQKAYIYAWVDGVSAAGFGAGVYCSGQAAKDDGNVVTAEDIRASAGNRRITYWAINDSCPPAPGCTFPKNPPAPSESGVSFAEVWQFAQSPQRKDIDGRCTNYSSDGECYAPGTFPAQHPHVDVNSARSTDPSHGRL
ncbi:MAG TPA: glycoside hydrolase domain-containing protein [Candidatus Binatia bacterium]|nr:glycoside hydrolase domain-containing protein [Candidatus Binatia bacterium]